MDRELSELYYICKRYFEDDVSAKKIAAEVNRLCERGDRPGWTTITERGVHRALRRSRSLVQVRAPLEETLPARLAKLCCRTSVQCRVVEAYGREALAALATRTAELVISLILKVADMKGAGKRVHVGFAPGGTMSDVVCALALGFAREANLPPLCFHALAAGVDPGRPHLDPNAFIMYLRDVLPADTQWVCLYAPPVVDVDGYANVMKLPVVRTAFEARDEIDIVVTGTATAEDEHGQLRHFLESLGEEGRRVLAESRWAGELHLLPFDETGPIERFAPIRAVTLFELPELVRLADSKGKYVVLAAGPCGVCGRHKAEALRPLLRQRSLAVFTHLVTELSTAQALLAEPPSGHA